MDYRQVGQAKEVHLDQTQRFAGVVFEGGGDGAIGTFQQWRGIGDGCATHDGGARMHTGLTNQAFDTFGLLSNALGIGVGIVHLAEFPGLGISFGRRVENIMQADVLAAGGRRGQGLSDFFSNREFITHDAGGVLQRLLGFDGAVDHALGNLVGAVFFTAVFDDSGTAFRIEVDIDIRQAHTLRVQEPLENQTVLQRVELGDAHGIGDHGACSRTTARPHHDAVVLGPLDVIGHDEEVTAKLHLADHTALIIGLLEHVQRWIAVITLFESLFDLLQEQRGLVPAFRTGELRHESAVLVIIEHDVATFGNEQRIVASVGMILEQLAHLLGGFDVIAGAVELESIRIIQSGAGVDAQHGILCAGIFGMHIMGIVGGQQRGVQLLGNGQQVVGDLVLDCQTVIHEFDKEIVLTEDVLEFTSGTQCLVELSQAQTSLDDARRASGGRDHTFGVGGQHFFIHTRVAHNTAFKIGHGRGFDEVDQTFVVFRPHGQVGDETTTGNVITTLSFGAPVHTGLVLTRGFRGHVSFDADDGLDAVGHTVGVHLIGTVHVAMIGNADCRHLKFGGSLGQIRDLRRTIKQ